MSYPATNEQDYPRMTAAVQALIAINVGIYFLQATIFQPETIQGALGFDFLTLPSRWWSVASYMFVHNDFWHVFWNMYALFIFGPRLEHLWGPKKFAFFYFLSGLGGLICYTLFFRDSGALLLGASGAIFGVMGAVVVTLHRHREQFVIRDTRIAVVIAVWAAYTLVLGALQPMIDNAAHLGGLVAGATAAVGMPLRDKFRRERLRRAAVGTRRVR